MSPQAVAGAGTVLLTTAFTTSDEMLKHVDHSSPIANPVRGWLNAALFDVRSSPGRQVNLLLTIVIVVAALLSMATTLRDIPATARQLIEWLELSIALAFATEYGLRLWSARKPSAYALSFYGIIDLAAWLPLVLFGDVYLALRLLRVLRLLKLVRHLHALRLFFSSLRDIFDIVLVVFTAIGIVVLVAGNLIHLLEPERFPDAFVGTWWALVTMTTVGYGDVVPVSTIGRLSAAVLMLTGITMFALLTGTLSVKIAQILSNRKDCPGCRRQISPDNQFCPRCGLQQQEEGDLACGGCGRQVDADDRYCCHCGHKR